MRMATGMATKTIRAPTIRAPFDARFTVVPYGWMVGVSGETGVRDLTADVDISFGKIFDHLRFGAMASFEAEYGPWVGIVDAVYASLRDDRTASLGPANPDLTMTLKLVVAQAYVGYTFWPARDVAVDILAGTRIWGLDESLSITGDRVSGERSKNNSWADALGGLRVRWAAAERWRVSAAGDGGGGGSKGTGGATATAGYDVSSRWTLFGAYRYLFLNRRKDDSFFTGHLGGPAIGGAYRW